MESGLYLFIVMFTYFIAAVYSLSLICFFFFFFSGGHYDKKKKKSYLSCYQETTNLQLYLCLLHNAALEGSFQKKRNIFTLNKMITVPVKPFYVIFIFFILWHVFNRPCKSNCQSCCYRQLIAIIWLIRTENLMLWYAVYYWMIEHQIKEEVNST